MEGEAPLVGFCKGSDEAIQACVWTPGAVTTGSSSSGGRKGKKDAKQKEQRFTILF